MWKRLYKLADPFKMSSDAKFKDLLITNLLFFFSWITLTTYYLSCKTNWAAPFFMHFSKIYQLYFFWNLSSTLLYTLIKVLLVTCCRWFGGSITTRITNKWRQHKICPNLLPFVQIQKLKFDITVSLHSTSVPRYIWSCWMRYIRCIHQWFGQCLE